MKSKGLTLIELTVIGLIGIVVVFLVVIGLRSFMKGKENIFTKGDLETQITALGQQLLMVGRGATLCEKISTTQLDCDVDFNVPPTGVVTRVSFQRKTISGQDVIEFSRPGSQAQFYPELKSDGNITDFTICNCKDMTGDPPTCNLEATKMNEAWKAVASSCTKDTDRYFRFRVLAKSSSFKAKDFQTAFQSAFYVRNPTPQGLVYQWGGQD